MSSGSAFTVTDAASSSSLLSSSLLSLTSSSETKTNTVNTWIITLFVQFQVDRLGYEIGVMLSVLSLRYDQILRSKIVNYDNDNSSSSRKCQKGSKFRQLLNVPSHDGQRLFKFLRGGEILPNLVTLSASKIGWGEFCVHFTDDPFGGCVHFHKILISTKPVKTSFLKSMLVKVLQALGAIL